MINNIAHKLQQSWAYPMSEESHRTNDDERIEAAYVIEELVGALGDAIDIAEAGMYGAECTEDECGLTDNRATLAKYKGEI